jgi:CHAT domain-containing protein
VAISQLRRTYTRELIDGWVQHSGQELTLASGTLAYLDCASSDWFAGLSHLDRAKSLRLRHDLALRRSPEAETFLKSEQVAFAVARGARLVTTSLHGHDLTPDAGDVRTEYWVDPKVRMQLDMATERGADEMEVATVEPVEVVRRLATDEAMLVIGLSPLGTIVCLLTASDTARPTACALVSEWPLPRWQRTFEKADLAEALAVLELVVASPLANALRSRPLSRLWVVPHLGTHAVPFHTLPSLGDVPTVHLPSMASLPDFLDRPNELAAGVAVAVGDPSEDLPLAAVEPDLVAEHLAHAGLTTHTYRGSSATRDAVRRHEDCVLLHFAGHSRADLITPHRSALLFYHPAATEQLRLGHDRLAELGTELTGWTEVSPGVREAVVPSVGVLREERFKRGDDLVVERRLEHTSGQTVLVHRRGPGALAFDAWSAGEIALRRDLRRCRLVVLSACEAGFGAGGTAMIDEMSGLPGALGLSGVTTVVAPLWPIPEDTGLLFTDFFYAALVDELSSPSSPTGVADVARAAHVARRRLASLSGAEAGAELRRLRSRAGDLRTKTMIGLAIHARSREPRPYSAPSEWAPFVVVGQGAIVPLPKPGILDR